MPFGLTLHIGLNEPSIVRIELTQTSARLGEGRPFAVTCAGQRGAAPAVGSLIAGRYRLGAKLGEGGMGAVWAATHEVTRKRYALKFLKGALLGRDELRRRFLREARATSAVDHPNIVTIYDAFEIDDRTPVMVMELLEGRTLGDILREGPRLSLSEAANLLLPAVSAVGTAHEHGVVHRDLKPDNVFVDRKGLVRVLDFGIAKLVEPNDDASDVRGLTRTGVLLGTPHYMSPEQGSGGEVDHRTDVWALGVMLYEALAGARPVEGEHRGHVLRRLLTDGITPIEMLVPGLPPEITTLVGRMLARERASRLQDLREAMRTLRPHANVDVLDFGPPSSIVA